MAGKHPAKAKARAKAKTKTLKDMTPDERLQYYLGSGKVIQDKLIAERVKRYEAGEPRPHNRVRRWICNVQGCVFGDQNNKSDVSPHFKEGRNPHPEHTYRVQDVIDVDYDNYLEDKDLKASAGATTKQEFYDILNRNLAAEAANASTDDATDEYLATWPNVKEDWMESNVFFEPKEE